VFNDSVATEIFCLIKNFFKEEWVKCLM
jgi:hypothetical protein